MKFVLYTNSVSAHQLPLARAIVARIGADQFRYVYTGVTQGGGQDIESNESWITQDRTDLDSCDVLLSGIRDIDLFRRRQRSGKKTFYMSERWFKPIRIPHTPLYLPGRIRVVVPAYKKMAKAFSSWLNSDTGAHYFAIGPWARKDMILIGVRANKIEEWAYFVAPSSRQDDRCIDKNLPLKVLWVGRMLWWKRVDTIIRAVSLLNAEAGSIRFKLTIVGNGPEEDSLRRLAKNVSRPLMQYSQFEFVPSVPIDAVRGFMQRNDVYVLSSNGEEGWGAALSEAIEEGMITIGTREAGASAALLRDEFLYRSGDVRGLATVLENVRTHKILRNTKEGVISMKVAVEKLMECFKSE